MVDISLYKGALVNHNICNFVQIRNFDLKTGTDKLFSKKLAVEMWLAF